MSTAGIHGTEHRKQDYRAFRLSAPRLPVSPTAGSTLPGSPQCLPARDSRLATAFRSPATAAPFGASIPGSTLPACYFVRWPAASTARSALRLHHRSRFAPVSAASLPRTRCGFTQPARPAAPPASTPLQEFYLPRDQSVLPVRLPAESALRTRPISLRSPRPVSIASVSATAQRSRFATFPEAGCSSNLLEPFSICALRLLSSTPFVISAAVFLNIYFHCFESVTRRRDCISCE